MIDSKGMPTDGGLAEPIKQLFFKKETVNNLKGESVLCDNMATMTCLQEALQIEEDNTKQDLIEVLANKGYVFFSDNTTGAGLVYREYYHDDIIIRIYFNKTRRVVIYNFRRWVDPVDNKSTTIRYDGTIRDVDLFEKIINTIQ